MEIETILDRKIRLAIFEIAMDKYTEGYLKGYNQATRDTEERMLMTHIDKQFKA